MRSIRSARHDIPSQFGNHFHPGNHTMKVEEAAEAIRRVVRPRRQNSRIVQALKITAGAATTIWLAMRVRKELYGPGGTRLERGPRRKPRDE